MASPASVGDTTPPMVCGTETVHRWNSDSDFLQDVLSHMQMVNGNAQAQTGCNATVCAQGDGCVVVSSTRGEGIDAAYATGDNEAVCARMRRVLTARVIDACHGELSYKSEMRVEGLLAITIDKHSVLVINIAEVHSYFRCKKRMVASYFSTLYLV